MSPAPNLPIYCPFMSAWPVKKTGQLARHNEGAVSIQLQARMQLQPSEVYTCHLIDNGKPAPQLRAVRTLNVYASDDEELDLNLVKHQVNEFGQIVLEVGPSEGPVIAGVSFFAPYDAEVEKLADNAQPLHFPWTLELTPASFDVHGVYEDCIQTSRLLSDPVFHQTHLRSDF